MYIEGIYNKCEAPESCTSNRKSNYIDTLDTCCKTDC